MQSTAVVLFLHGIPDDGKVIVKQMQGERIVSYTGSGGCNVYPHIETDLFAKRKLVLDVSSSSAIAIPNQTQILFNAISEPDSHLIALKKANLLIQQMAPNIPCINSPDLVMQTSREQVAQKLQDIPGLIVPKTKKIASHNIRDMLDTIEKQGLQYPLLMRGIGIHGGSDTLKINSPEALLALRSRAFDGREYYFTAFYDFGEQGLYRMYRFIVINGEPFLKHIRTHNHWLIHRKRCADFMHAHPIYEDEAKKIFEHFETDLKRAVQPIVFEIFQRLKLDIFGIDCHIDQQGQMLLFEANANMNLLYLGKGKPPAHQVAAMNQTKQALVQMIIEKMDTVN